jgi:DNA-binding transcriptional ArsR family regulator
MVSGNSLAEIAGLIGDVARANILSALMDGRALTASELAWHAGVGASTTSEHLARLTAAGLVAVARQGRHRYFRLASAEIAQAIEALMAVAAMAAPRHRPVGPRDVALRTARTCYDHLAGRLGIALAEAMVQRGYLLLDDEAGALTPAGQAACNALGLDLRTSRSRPLCRTCLDWSERRPHLAGRLGSALCQQAFALGWIERTRDSRAVHITALGAAGFTEWFGLGSDIATADR